MGSAATIDRQETVAETSGVGTYLLPGYCLSWTTRPGYNIPTNEAQRHAIGLVQHLDRVARLRERLEIRLVGGASAPAEHASGDIGLWAAAALQEDAGLPTVDLLFSDGASLSRRVAVSLPWSEVERRLTRLLRGYMVEGCAKDTFAAWTGGLTDGEIRERLGLPANLAEHTATA